jgi:hypothetical protein
MADVRLTAVNPDDSQVYPVACNDKGELVLSGATDLDVLVKLEVAGTTYADGTGLFIGYGPDDERNRTISFNKGGGAQLDGVVQCGGFVSYVRTDATDQNLATFNSNIGGLNTPQIAFTADGSGTFSGNVAINGSTLTNTGLGIFTDALSTNGIQVKNISGVGTVHAAFRAYNSDDLTTAQILSDGTASFESSLTSKYPGKGQVQSAASGAHGIMVKDVSNNINAVINWDGSASFTKNVTAPNITFKLAPATAASMPAPLIDEGFAVEGELDLLSELIKMKLQIRDLNAFMQRTLQDGTETTQ